MMIAEAQMVRTDIEPDEAPRRFEGRQIRDTARAIVSAGFKRANPWQHNFIATILDRAVQGDAEPDFTKEVFVFILDERVQVKFARKGGGERRSQPNILMMGNEEFYICPGVVQLQGVFLKLDFSNDLIVATRIPMREVARIMKEEETEISLRSKWAEDNRTAQQVKVRLEPDLLARIERQAVKDGISRNAWISQVLQKALPPKP